MTEGTPVDVLPELSPGDEVLLYFDHYQRDYEYKPDSPLRTEVLDVTTEEVSRSEGVYPGTLTKVFLSVPESDERADTYWIEHRIEERPDETEERASHLLFEEDLLALSSSGGVGHVDKIEVLPDD